MQNGSPAPRRRIEKTALAVTRWVGSPTSLIIHTILFIAAFLSVHYEVISFDEMLLFLTTIVSLEAIYLSILIQMTINYTTQELEDIGEDVEEMQEDIGELQEDVEDISEDVEEITEDEEKQGAEEELRKAEQSKTLADIQTDLRKLMNDIEHLQKNQPPPSGAVPLL